MRFIKTLKNLFGLPAGYTRLEYLASNGNQYIDTEYVMSDGKTMGFESDMMWTQSGGSANFFYGYRSVNSAEYHGDMRAFFIYGTSASPAGRLAIRYGVDTENSTQAAVSFNNKYKMTFDGTDLKVNGTTYVTHSQAYNPANYQSMWLFNCNCTGYYSADVSGFIGRIYHFQIFEDGVTVRDFIPCLDPFGKACMYDLVEHKAHYNKGTGEFTYGRQIIPVEYLESTGTQWIDTGVNANSNPKYEINFGISYTNPSSPTNQYIGADYGGTYGVVNGNFQWSSVPVVANKRYEIQFVNENGTRNGYVDGVVHAGNFYRSDGYRVLLFAAGQDVTGANHSTPFSCKLYYFKAFLGGVLVRDYIPAKDENGVAFMFDRVTNSAYLNAGSGSFTVGKSIYQPSLRFVVDNNRVVPAGFKEVEYLESTGTQYIDTGIIPTNTHGISINFSFSSNESFDASWCPIGARTEDIRFWINKSVDDSGLTFGFGDYKTSRQTQPKNTLLKASLNLYNNRKMIYVNGNYQENITSSISNLSNTLYLFRANVNGSISFIPPDCRIYKAQISEGSVLIRDFIPCIDPLGVPCMYDLIEGKPYYNQGTGTFSIGRQIIPVEYLEVPYTNNVYFQTMFEAQETDKIIFDSNVIRTEATGDCYIVRATNTYFDVGSRQNTFYIRFGSTSGSVGTSSVFGRHIYELYKEHFDIDGITSASPSWGSIGGNWIIGSTGSAQNVRHYSIKIKNTSTNETRADFIPCKDENNVGYMFDRVNHVIHENKGTGSLIIGDAKKELTFRLPKDPIPREYQIVSYLESSGTQYIDTLWHPSSNDLRVNFKVQSMGSPSATAICGAEKRDVVPRWVFIMYGQSDDTNKTFPLIGDWNNVNPSTAFTFKNGTVLDIDWTANSTSTTITDKVSNTTYNYTFASNITYSNNDVTLKLFCNATSQMSSIRMYKYKIWDNNILVRNFVPVIRKSDSVAGMYDIVTKQFFENAGTGTFNYG